MKTKTRPGNPLIQILQFINLSASGKVINYLFKWAFRNARNWGSPKARENVLSEKVEAHMVILLDVNENKEMSGDPKSSVSPDLALNHDPAN